MKFVYAYKSKDNVRHTGEIRAASKDAAFATLKMQGIKPIRVDEAPGVWNKIVGKGKRWAAIGVLLVVLSVVLVAFFRERGRVADATGPMPRHHVYGDPARIEEFGRSGFASLFDCAADRELAHFAQPGDVSFMKDAEWKSRLVAALKSGFTGTIRLLESDEREACELKRIVMWMRDEYNRYMSDGLGTPEKFAARLEKRQQYEFQVYNVAKGDLKEERSPEKWERINSSLRRIGLPTISAPEIETDILKSAQQGDVKTLK